MIRLIIVRGLVCDNGSRAIDCEHSPLRTAENSDNITNMEKDSHTVDAYRMVEEALRSHEIPAKIGNGWAICCYSGSTIYLVLSGELTASEFEEFVVGTKAFIATCRRYQTEPLTVHFDISQFPIPSATIRTRLVRYVKAIDRIRVRLPIYVHSDRPELSRRIGAKLLLRGHIQFVWRK